MTIIEQICDYARMRVDKAKQAVPLETLRQEAYALPKGDFAFEKALKKEGISFICECKPGIPLQRIDRVGFSLSGDRQGIRSGGSRLYFCIDRAKVVFRGGPLSAADCARGFASMPAERFCRRPLYDLRSKDVGRRCGFVDLFDQRPKNFETLDRNLR